MGNFIEVCVFIISLLLIKFSQLNKLGDSFITQWRCKNKSSWPRAISTHPIISVGQVRPVHVRKMLGPAQTMCLLNYGLGQADLCALIRWTYRLMFFIKRYFKKIIKLILLNELIKKNIFCIKKYVNGPRGANHHGSILPILTHNFTQVVLSRSIGLDMQSQPILHRICGMEWANYSVMPEWATLILQQDGHRLAHRLRPIVAHPRLFST